MSPDLNNILDDDGTFDLINPEIRDMGEKIATTFLGAGCESWSTYVSRGVLYSPLSTTYLSPAEGLNGDAGKTMVITKIIWSGTNAGECFLLIPDDAAKGVIAFFLAVAMGTEPDAASINLDDEAMDAYSELVNTLLGQGSQALRGALGGEIQLSVEKTEVIDPEQKPPMETMGSGEMLCHTGQLTIEGMAPTEIRLFMPVSVTGMSANIPQKAESIDVDDIKSHTNIMTSHPEIAESNNTLAHKICLPVVVVLAEQKMRLEVIQNLKPGSILEFRKLSGELLDICAGNIKFGEGEVVIINQHFGVQLQKMSSRRSAS